MNRHKPQSFAFTSWAAHVGLWTTVTFTLKQEEGNWAVKMRKRHVHWQNTSHCISIVIALDTITAYYIWFNRGINRVLINGFYSVCTANTGDRERKNHGTSLTSLLKILFWGKVEKWLFKLFFQNKCPCKGLQDNEFCELLQERLWYHRVDQSCVVHIRMECGFSAVL